MLAGLIARHQAAINWSGLGRAFRCSTYQRLQSRLDGDAEERARIKSQLTTAIAVPVPRPDAQIACQRHLMDV